MSRGAERCTKKKEETGKGGDETSEGKVEAGGGGLFTRMQSHTAKQTGRERRGVRVYVRMRLLGRAETKQEHGGWGSKKGSGVYREL